MPSDGILWVSWRRRWDKVLDVEIYKMSPSSAVYHFRFSRYVYFKFLRFLPCSGRKWKQFVFQTLRFCETTVAWSWLEFRQPCLVCDPLVLAICRIQDLLDQRSKLSATASQQSVRPTFDIELLQLACLCGTPVKVVSKLQSVQNIVAQLFLTAYRRCEA